VELELARWSRAIDALSKGDERDAETLDFFEHRN
jgi:hypothetical protein